MAKPAEKEQETALAWLHDRDLLNDHNGKKLPLEWALHRLQVLSKCQFGDTVDEATWRTFLLCFLSYEDKLAAIQMDIKPVWDPKYHYHLDLTNTVPIRAKPPRLCPEEEAWLDIHLDKLVAKGVISPILPREQLQCVIPYS